MIKKIKSLIILMSPIILTSSILGIVYSIKNNKTDSYNPKGGVITDDNSGDDQVATSRFDSNVKYRKSEIFPNVKINDIYEFIRVKNEVAVFSKEIVARMIKIITTGLGVSFGELNFEWQFKNMQHLIINAYWYERSGDMKKNIKYLLSKNYSIKILIN